MSASMRYAYFPGCSAAGSGISFTLSGDYVVNKIGLELVEIPDWCCCGTSAALLTDRNLALALPGRSLAIAEADPSTAGLDVATPCAGCFASLKGVQHYVRQSQKHREFVESLVEMPYAASAEIFSLLELMCKDTPREAIDTTISHSLRGVKVACYYGCALVRPPKVTQFDDPENPQSMEGLLALTGAEPVDWAFKVECCGAAHQITEPKNARVLVERIFEDAAANGAEVIATACPLCWMNLDLRLGEINKHRAEEGKPIFDIPVYYFTQLLGLAMGGNVKELGMDRHFYHAESLAKRVITKAEAAAAAAAEAEAAAAKKRPAAKKEKAAAAAEAAADDGAEAPAAEAAPAEAPAAEAAPAEAAPAEAAPAAEAPAADASSNEEVAS